MTTPKEREANTRLAMMLKPGMPHYLAGDPAQRRQGKTFRSVIWSLLQASEEGERTILHMSCSKGAARHALQMALDMTSHLERKVYMETRVLKLINRSTIEFRSVEDDAHYFHGRRFEGVAKDY